MAAQRRISTDRGKRAKQRRRRLDKRLAAYAVTAGATAAIGGHTAHAAIIYTPGPFNTGLNGQVGVDFNGDAAPDFLIEHTAYLVATSTYTDIQTNKLLLGNGSGAANQMQVVASDNLIDALNGGDAIQGPFAAGGAATLRAFALYLTSSGSFTTDLRGHFDTSAQRFVGVKFDLSGATLSGWIGLEVNQGGLTGNVTGYAYEDSGGGIRAGQIPEPTPLALLAMGASGVAALRRRRRENQDTTPAQTSPPTR